MCQKCVDACLKHYPLLTAEEWGELLMGATCFPFGSPEQVEEQLAELKKNTDGTLGSAIAWVEQQLWVKLERCKENEGDK